MILRGSLFRKYVIYFVTLVTVTLAASGAISVYFTYQEHKAALLDLQREKAAAAAARIETYALEIAHQIEWILAPQIGVQNNKQRQLDFLKLLRQVPAITEIFLLDRAGMESLRVSRLGVDGETSSKNFSKEAKFLEAKGGKTYFSPVYFSQQTEPYVTLSMPNVSAKDGVTVA